MRRKIQIISFFLFCIFYIISFFPSSSMAVTDGTQAAVTPASSSTFLPSSSSVPAAAQPRLATTVPPFIIQNTNNYPIGLENNLLGFIDKTNELSINDILTPYWQKQLLPLNIKTSPKRFMTSNTTLWLKFVMTNSGTHSASILLRCWLDSDGIYVYIQNKSGQYERYGSEGFLNWVRLITFEPHETKTIYFSGFAPRFYVFPLTVFDFKSYDRVWTEEFFSLASFIGIAVGLIFYNLFLFISTRDKNYFLYIMTWTAFVIYKLLEANIFTSYLFPNMSNHTNWMVRDFFVTLSITMFVAYINSVVKVETYNPRIQKISMVWYVLCWLSYPFYIYHGGAKPYHYYYLISMTFGLLLSSVTVTLSMLDGFRPSRYLFIGVISLLSAAITHITIELTIFRSALIRFLFPIASSLEMILQSFALADRYNLIKENEEKVKKELILSQKLSLQQQSNTINSYERFLPKQVLPLLHKENFLQINLADNIEINLAVLFSDIRGFTQLSEQMTPQECFEFINRYLAHMAPIIGDENGVIDKYIGDAIMALFPVDPDSAVRAALKLIEEAPTIRTQQDKSIRAGAAIHYGQLILGVIGSEERMECTVISDAVNIASRLESMNKVYGTSLLITDIALAKCQTSNKFYKRILDKVRFYGKTVSNVVYEIYGYEDHYVDKKLLEITNIFEQGIFYYQHRNFIHAFECFKECVKIYPEDNPSQLYIQRCTHFLANGVPPNWDSTYQIDK